MVTRTQKQGSLSIFDEEFDVSMAVGELSSNIKETDKWSKVVSREAPVDTKHGVFPIGQDIVFNDAYRQMLYEQDDGNGTIAFNPKT